MTHATLSRVAPAVPRPRAGRASALALLPAGVVAGFGLGLAALALAAPPRDVAPIPPVDTAAPAAADTGAVAARHPGWPALFGTPPQAAPAPRPVVAEPEPVEEDEDFDPLESFDDEAPLLRGLALDEDGAHAYALLETDEGLVVARVGETLPGGYEVLDISIDGVIIDVEGEAYRIGFPDDPDDFPSAALDDDLQDFPIVARIERGPDSYPAPAADSDEEWLDDAPPQNHMLDDQAIDGEAEPGRRDRWVPFPMGISR